ncbi:hypothetical protein COCC4DRAFT_71080 [Bipolaris maydis ATCC 48331]|uniref:Sld7 C-terminal domain-containing protein n=2 Tax=Cochliobolus heterostrophus TaxID=5016 RepID=M2TMC2_COCH5|nr:uncharacterized protein COCC4DRAFT_71080 [Bipolaris maydis ATCC 48331]EMD87679.1 hypothetical protein COCHEDRAFT_1197737 [Bipolaris maydis C5]KAJ5023061.1 hypothetical protein J3E73DRAFT_426103 [Bipolaris maydis]ENI06878.1 hypothetical protein COCC4DRAFT_71080 [Bipolaris maydis ATCC 48331]KAJ5056192.1 hypothetical protein J3E74DRAFT_468799 [Bipolaris maydis]KAJ6193938.1 hypothetical protein J3E72DRAFT_250940 [Bipolaris maydis]
MTDVWSGHLLLPDGRLIKEISLTTQNGASSPILSTTSLRFLTTVDTAKIPLYLTAGPSLDVWTTEESTQAWFESLLLSKPTTSPNASNHDTNEWWNLARSQSPIGILAQVQDVSESTQKPRITEILFYGTIAAHAAGGIPTLPSSLSFVDNAGEQLPELRVHATPLSSDMLQYASIDPPIDNDAHFLPPMHNVHAPPRSPKKHRDIFEEATIANKKARGRGGRAVSAAAARGSESQLPYAHRKSSLSIDKRASPFPDSRPSSSSGPLPHSNSRPLSRSPSISSDARPMSRKGPPEAHTRRSNLSQVATVPIKPEEPTTESRNKDALVKVVMAAMRMHGLQQRKQNKSRRASLAVAGDEIERSSEQATPEESAKDDEYKLIYHQTYKGAALALRNHMSEKPLHVQPDRMRDVVEKLLVIFLSDPLAEPPPADVPADPVATPGSKSRPGIPGSTHGHASPFDLPSTSRPRMMRSVTDSHVFTGSPVSKKRPSANRPAPT